MTFSIKVKSCYSQLRLGTVIVLVSSGTDFQVKSCDKRVQTPGMSPPRAGAWTYCLFTP